MTYSLDLRERVLAAVRVGGQSLPQIAKTYRISESTLDKWCQRWRATGRVAALPWAGGRRRALRASGAVIRAEVKKQPDVSLSELCQRVAKQIGVVASPSMMCRELQALNLPRQKSRSTTASAKRRA
jgi:transposase